MMHSIRHMILGVSAAILVFPAGIAMAGTQPGKDAEMPKYEAVMPEMTQFTDNRRQNFDRFAQRNQERRISASQAKSIAQSRVPGAKFVNVQMSGRDTYRVRLQQKNGRIVDVYVDARTGRVKN